MKIEISVDALLVERTRHLDEIKRRRRYIRRINREITNAVYSAHGSKMTRRQREVLTLVNDGLGNKEIGAELKIAECTVKFHVGNLLAMFGVDSRFKLATVRQAVN